jgi:MraZ protein
MNRFVSTFESSIDARGRVSVPASFRAVLDRDAATFGDIGGIYCYPSLDAPALDAGSERLARKIDSLLNDLPEYSDERDQLSVALYGNVQILSIDGDGRIVIPQGLREHAGLDRRVTFVGLGDKFQIWSPEVFIERDRLAREKVKAHRKLFDAGRRLAHGEPEERRDDRPGGSSGGASDGEGSARE